MTLTQEDRELVMDTGDCSNYLQHMTSDITNMAFAFSHWDGGSLDWMQHGVCTGGCERTAMNHYSNLQFWTQGSSPDDNDDNSQPTTSYTFGDACMDLTDDDCADVDCAVCRMSWPTDTMFNPTTDDPEAMCRCEIEVDPARSEPTDFTYGGDCASLIAGECGNVDCEVCSSSWPTDSPYLFPETQDPLSMCRCQQEAPTQLPDPIQETQYMYDYECTAESTEDKSLCTDGCNCHISWAIDSPWETQCRCLPRQRAPEGYHYGEPCVSPHS